LSTAGRIGSNFRAPYVEAAELAESIYYPGDLARTGLYTFSPTWKKVLLQWFYDNQDSKTGYWIPKLRSSGERLNSGDLVSTEKIIKLSSNKLIKEGVKAAPSVLGKASKGLIKGTKFLLAQ